MKRFTHFALAALCACLFAGCGSSPDDAAVDFLTAFQTGDYKTYASLCLDRVRPEDFQWLVERIREDGGIKDIRVEQSERNGDKACVTVSYRVEASEQGPSATLTKKLNLRRTDGKWMVQVD